MPELDSEGYAGYALDLIGHGESEKPEGNLAYTFEHGFAHFSAWIDSLEINVPLILTCHSLDCGISILNALNHPEWVKDLILVNPFYNIHQLPPVLRGFSKGRLINKTLINRTPYCLFRLMVGLTSFNEYIGQRETHILPEHIRYQTALDYKRVSSEIYNIRRALPDLTSSLHQLTQPALLVWGGRDQTLSPSSFPKIKDLLSNLVDSHIMPVCGHVPHQCRPEKFNQMVTKF